MSKQDTANADEALESVTAEELEAEAALADDDTGFDDLEDDGSDDEETDEQEDEPDESEDEADEEDESEQSEETDSDEEPQKKEEATDPAAEQRKRNQEAAARRIAEKQAREQQMAEAERESLAQVADDPTKLAIRQLEINAYKTTVQGNSDRLVNGYEKAVAHIDLFKSSSPEVIAELDAALDEFQQMHVKFDQFGNPIQVDGDLYQFLETKAERIRRLTGIREVNKKKAVAQTKARTDLTPSKAPKKGKTDPDLDAFDEEASRW